MLPVKTYVRKLSNCAFRRIIKQTKDSFSEPPSVDWKHVVSRSTEYAEEALARKQDAYSDTVTKILALSDTYSRSPNDESLRKELQYLTSLLPNTVHPDVKCIDGDFKIVKMVGEKKQFPFEPLIGAQLFMEKDLLKMPGTRLCGERSYYFVGDLVKLEQALIDYTVQKLLKLGFTLISVPDILSKDIIERCGMDTAGPRTQIYKLDSDLYGEGWCLSGTSEIAIASFLKNRDFPASSLPKHYAAVSRCYRAEISHISTEKGIYRVHQFTKVEMFGICMPHQSEKMLELFLSIQEELFSSFDLHYRVIDMAPAELSRQAYRKYDIEAWMPGLKRYGEISSCSNCSDYQSRRLNIRSGETFLHTVNGTACAIPRTISAIAETHQIERGRICIPDVLKPLTGIDVLGMKRGPSSRKVTKAPKNIPRSKV